MVWECIEEALASDGEIAFQRKLTQDDKDVLALVRARLAGKIFDSSPCYLWLSVGVRAIGTAIPGLVPRYLLQVCPRTVSPERGHCTIDTMWPGSRVFASRRQQRPAGCRRMLTYTKTFMYTQARAHP